MDSRALLGVDIGFYAGTILWGRLKSFYGIKGLKPEPLKAKLKDLAFRSHKARLRT